MLQMLQMFLAVTSGQTSVPIAEMLLDQSVEGYKVVI